jgi:hypothetical protein
MRREPLREGDPVSRPRADTFVQTVYLHSDKSDPFEFLPGERQHNFEECLPALRRDQMDTFEGVQLESAERLANSVTKAPLNCRLVHIWKQDYGNLPKLLKFLFLKTIASDRHAAPSSIFWSYEKWV